jgi:hypothetical protein
MRGKRTKEKEDLEFGQPAPSRFVQTLAQPCRAAFTELKDGEPDI